MILVSSMIQDLSAAQTMPLASKETESPTPKYYSNTHFLGLNVPRLLDFDVQIAFRLTPAIKPPPVPDISNLPCIAPQGYIVCNVPTEKHLDTINPNSSQEEGSVEFPTQLNFLMPRDCSGGEQDADRTMFELFIVGDQDLVVEQPEEQAESPLKKKPVVGQTPQHGMVGVEGEEIIWSYSVRFPAACAVVAMSIIFVYFVFVVVGFVIYVYYLNLLP